MGALVRPKGNNELAKSAGPAPKNAAQSQPSKSVETDKKKIEAADAAGSDAAPSQDAAKPKDIVPATGLAPLDLNSFAKARDALEQQLKFWTIAIDDTNRSWRQFDDQVVGASSELVRLRDIEKEFLHLSTLHGQEMAKAEAVRLDLADTKAREASATDRAAKLEDICEQIKERAMDIHTALQTTRANEQRLQAEVQASQSELVTLRRAVQEEEAGRIAAEDRNGKMLNMIAELEAVETEARDRVAKLTEDNKIMVQQLPQLLADRNSWEKQFSASERENVRMQAERKVSGDRIGELESEIRTLRADLASLVGGKQPQEATPATVDARTADERKPEAVEEEIEGLDDLDLVSSLDRAFGAGDVPDPKRSH